MHNPLPIKLKTDPIIDAVIEIRVSASQSLSSVMQGVLLQATEVEYRGSRQLPMASIPEEIRRYDANLKFQPLDRVTIGGGFNLLIGDQMLAVVSPIPYIGGEIFKEKASQIIKILLDLPIINSINRLSIKYTDFIETESLKKLDEYLNLNFQVGSLNMDNTKSYDLKFQFENQDVHHLIRLAGLLQIEKGKKGILLEVDTIKNYNKFGNKEFKKIIERECNNIHLKSKIQFFSLLTKSALNKLGAVYE